MSNPAPDAPGGMPSEPTAPPAPPAQPATPPGDKSPEDVAGLKAALKAERDARRTAEDRAKELEPYETKIREAENANKSELTKVNEALAAERDARTKADAALLRYQVGAERGVPPKLVPLLVGATKQEIEASAEMLLGEIGSTKPQVPGRPAERMATGEPSSSLDDEDPMALIAKARGQDLTPKR